MNNKVLLSYAIRERLLAVSHETAFPKGTNAEPPEFVPVEHSLSALYAAVEKHRPRAVLWELFPDDAGAVTVIRTARRRWGVQCPSFIILGEFVIFAQQSL